MYSIAAGLRSAARVAEATEHGRRIFAIERVLHLDVEPALNRWLNIILGVIYTVLMLVAMRGAWVFYMFLGVIEVVLTALIVWHAWNWPREDGGGSRDDVDV